jgi:hypothetical protein
VRKWGLLLGGLLVWTVDFFLLYAIASLFPGEEVARLLALLVTVAALAANAWIMWIAWAITHSADEVDRWAARVGLGGGAISFVSVLWQGFPAVLS